LLHAIVASSRFAPSSFWVVFLLCPSSTIAFLRRLPTSPCSPRTPFLLWSSSPFRSLTNLSDPSCGPLSLRIGCTDRVGAWPYPSLVLEPLPTAEFFFDVTRLLPPTPPSACVVPFPSRPWSEPHFPWFYLQLFYLSRPPAASSVSLFPTLLLSLNTEARLDYNVLGPFL